MNRTIKTGFTSGLMSIAVLVGLVGSSLASANIPHSQAWSFGVMSDTQWIGTDDGKNPNTVAVDIINQVNQQFIDKKVKFVIQVGDLEDQYSSASMNTTAVFRQDLYNHGIGFYPLRGNHESNSAAANQFVTVFPQTQTGTMNTTPAGAYTVTPNPDAATQPFPAQSGSPFQVGAISANPAAPTGSTGLSYAFDYNNARFVLLDQFANSANASHSMLTSADVAWTNGQLSGRPAETHAFVFGHKGIITENHVDTLFGNNPSLAASVQNTFINSLDSNGVRYYMGGHDHMYNRAVVTDNVGASMVQDIILASDSSKFYIPFGTAGYTKRAVTSGVVSNNGTLASADPTQTNDYIYDVLVAGGSTRETPISQELNTVGYYVYTVDGSNVTVDYYSAVVNPTLSAGEYLINTTPHLNFTKRETFGYGLNGRQFMVAGGSSFTAVSDSFGATSASILSGTNNSTATDSSGRALTRDVDTGWTPKNNGLLASDILTLWGMDNTGNPLNAEGDVTTGIYTLSMSYDPELPEHLGNGGFGIAAKDINGDWVNAVDLNFGGTAQFIKGAWKAGYGLGTYGVDPKTKTAWAVIDYNGSFAVANGIEPVPGQRN